MAVVGQKRARGDEALESFVFGASSESENEGSDLEQSLQKTISGQRVFGFSDDEEENEKAEVGAAWQDPDDENLNVNLENKNRTKKYKQTVEEDVVSGKDYAQRLRDNFEKVKGKQNWATKTAEDSDDSDDEEAKAILRLSGAGIASSKGGVLPSGELTYVPLADANRKEKSKCVAKCVKFHPNSELLTVAGLDKHLRLFHVDGEENAKLASYYFEKFPITSTTFIRDGKEMILTGDRHTSFYTYDVESGQAQKISSFCGRKDTAYTGVVAGPSSASSLKSAKMFAVRGQNGVVHLADQKTKHLIRSLKVTGECTAVAFHPTRDVVYATTQQSLIYEYDVGSGRCINKIHDLSAVNITSLAVSSNTSSSSNPVVMACGTSSGVVDLFDVSDGLEKNQTPFKSLMNLQTSVDTVAFHPQGQALFAASSELADAVKMWQRPTYTAFQNFPAPRRQKTQFQNVHSVDFAANGGLVAMGNDGGRVLLYSLSHYSK